MRALAELSILSYFVGNVNVTLGSEIEHFLVVQISDFFIAKS